jgi:hypothetical protein
MDKIAHFISLLKALASFFLVEVVVFLPLTGAFFCGGAFFG